MLSEAYKNVFCIFIFPTFFDGVPLLDVSPVIFI